ncbi:unnamed protein product [Somion occarium]|uniref:Uncharacterized protein n=1 Tax=Somion occarium TaxID=3059160 RepID=A0ABP1EA90_9APHY
MPSSTYNSTYAHRHHTGTPEHQSQARVKRKPPPAFLYSAKYPLPDPTDPFVPLAVLRERAHSSTTALVTPPDEPFTTNPAIHSTTVKNALENSASKLITRPWHHLTGGYLSDATKPSRPPRSKIRPGRDSVSYFSDVDVTPDVHQNHRHSQSHQNAGATTTPAKPTEAKANPRLRHPQGTPAHHRDSQYHYRRRSQSVMVVSPTSGVSNAPPLSSANTNASINVNATNTPARSVPQMQASRSQDPVSSLQAGSSRQYTYGDRQSHGYMYDYHDDLGEFHGRRRRLTSKQSSRTGTESISSLQSHHPTPPMTPDDTASTMSTNPPRKNSLAGRRSESGSPPMILRDVPHQKSQTKVVAPATQPKSGVALPPSAFVAQKEPERKQLAQVGDTPASIHSSDFTLLLPPSAPKTLPHAPISRSQTHLRPSTATGPHTHAQAHAPTYAPTTRHAESEPEIMPSSENGRRTRNTSFDSLKRRLRKPNVAPTGVRGKKISNPSPVTPARKPSFASDSSVLIAHGTEGRTLLNPTSTGAQAVEPSSKLMIPKPKKSLSTVNLNLKPLPNVSVGPATSPTDMAGTAALGLGTMNALDAREDENRARSEDLLLHNVPKPQPVTDPRVVKRPAQPTVVQHTQPPTRRVPVSAPQSIISHIAPAVVERIDYESDSEDMGTYTAMIALRELLTPVSSQYPWVDDPRRSNFFASPSHPPSPVPSERSIQQASPAPSSPSRPTHVRPVPKQPGLQRTPALHRRSESPIERNSPSNVSAVGAMATTRPLLVPRKNDVSEQPLRPESPVHKKLPRQRSHSPLQRPSAPEPIEPPISAHRVPLPHCKDSPKQRSSPIPHRSDSPVHHRAQIIVSPNRAPSPVKRRSSPVQKRSESPVLHRQPPTRKRSESPVQQRQVPQRQMASHTRSVSPVQRQLPGQRRTESPVRPPPQVRRRPDSPAEQEYMSPTPPRAQSPEPLYTLSPDPPRSETPDPTYTMSLASHALTSESPYGGSAIRSISPPPRAMSPITSVQESSEHGSSRARSSTPSSQKARCTPEARPLPKMDNSCVQESEAEEAEGYLPVAQIRSQPSSASKQTTSSQGTSRKHSTQVPSAQNHQRKRARSPTPASTSAPVRARNNPMAIVSPKQMQALPREPSGSEPYSPPVRRQRTAPPTPALALASPTLTTRSHGLLSSHSDPHSRTTRSTRHRRDTPPSTMPFSEDAIVTREQLARASSLVVVAQNGLRVPFGDLFKEKKTIVIFIRHFWCAMCQDYMYSISKNVDPGALRRADVELVIIGNGSPGMIKSYRNIFRTPFSLYTDPTMHLYSALGMTLRSNDPGLESERGSYVRHGLVGGIAMVVRNALRVGMPIWEKGGEVMQLGGEFVFGPGMSCSYSHRMKNTRSHSAITDVLAAADVQTYYAHIRGGTSRSMLPIHDEEEWMRDRRRSLARLRNKKKMRREGAHPRYDADDLAFESDDESDETQSGELLFPTEATWGDGTNRPPAEEVIVDPEERHRTHKHRRARGGHGGFVVSNPDPEPDYLGRMLNEDIWPSDRAKLFAMYPQQVKPAQRNEDQDAYTPTHEVLS